MKIAMSAVSNSIDGNLDLRFGRAKYFLVYNLDDNEYEFVSNKQNVMAQQGAGIQSGERVLKEQVNAVISGHYGPKAFKVLQSAGIELYTSEAKPMRDVIDDFKTGHLSKLSSADVEGHW